MQYLTTNHTTDVLYLRIFSNIVLCSNQNYVIIVTIMILIIFGNCDFCVDNNKHVAIGRDTK